MTSARSIHRFLSTRLGEIRRHLAAFIIASALIALFICLIAIPTAHIVLATYPAPTVNPSVAIHAARQPSSDLLLICH